MIRSSQYAIDLMDDEGVEAVRVGGQFIRRDDVRENEAFALLVISHIESVRKCGEEELG